MSRALTCLSDDVFVLLLDLPSSLKRLYTNPVWLGISLLTVVEQSVVNAFITFISKYLQVRARPYPSTSPRLTGLMLCVSR